MTQRPYRQILVGLAISPLLWGCGGGDSTPQSKSYEATLQVDHYMDSCNGLFESLCLRVRRGDSASWEFIGNAIDGFKYEWGHRYSLRVLVTESTQAPVPDAPIPRTHYQLLQLLSDTVQPATTSFTITLHQARYSLEQAQDGSWRLIDRPLSCSTLVCSALSKAQSASQDVQLDFDHSNSPQGPLNLLAVRLSGA